MERNGGYEPALNRITGAMIHSAMELHTRLGPGLFESVYTRVLERISAGRSESRTTGCRTDRI